MSDALLSPAVGGTLWAAAAGLMAAAARRVERDPDPRRVPLMGVMGAFVFAAQMVNFSIPGTGSSGHLGGGLLLAALLGPAAGFLVLASVLTVQALLFADGGLLALGANILNVAAASCFVAYPLLFRPLAGRPRPGARLVAASVAAGMGGLSLGALGVVLETAASGISTLPVRAFLSLMVPVHLAIGVVEGLATAAVLSVLWRARPELAGPPMPVRGLRPVVAGVAAAAVLLGAACSWLASADPDGLEWSVARTAGGALRAPADGVRATLARVQAAIAPFPGYRVGGLRSRAERDPKPAAEPPTALEPRGRAEAGTSLSGIAGAGMTLALVSAVAWGLGALRRRSRGSGCDP